MSIVAVVGGQWGDEGKGKIVDLLSKNSSYVARYQGGSNAGHTVYYKNKKIVLHQIPAGVLRENTQCILGKGMVIDPIGIVEEIDILSKNKINFSNRILIDYYAHVVTPIHKYIDKNNEKITNNFIGTTCKGIGPTYADKYNRIGIRTVDLLSYNNLKNKIDSRLKLAIEKKQIANSNLKQLKTDIENFYICVKKITPYITDTHPIIYNNLKSNILIEGAQGTLLDIDHGTFPFVTSSNCSSAGIGTGLGLPTRHVNNIIGIFKAYVTRVGSGPFPTELFNENGKKLQKEGNEFGATTGRVRRCGWFDLVAAKYSTEINGLNQIALTKLDILDHFDTIKVCTHYTYNGKKTSHLSEVLNNLKEAKPVYKEFKGWNLPTSQAKSYDDFPIEAKEYIEFLSKNLKIPIRIVSVGPKRNQIINII